MNLINDPELDFMMSHRPNIYGNTVFIALLKLLASLLLLLFIAMGVYYSYKAGEADFKGEPARLGDLMKMLDLQLSVAFFLLSICMVIIIWIGRMLVRRNQFIMALEEWYLAKKKPGEGKAE